MDDYEPITKKVREYIERHPTMMHAVGLTNLLDNIDAIHRSLEAENERLRDASERGDDWIKLPVDADDVPVREGDELWSDNGVWVKVKRLQFENGKWAVCVEDKTGIYFYAAFENMHHYCPDTWESIIADAREYRLNTGGSYLWKNKSDELVARCKALCERTREGEE